MELISVETAEKILLNIGISDKDDDLINSVRFKAAAVIAYLNKGGAKIKPDSIADDELNCVSIGVNDLLNNTAGGTDFSPAFKMISLQICTVGGSENGKSET